MAERPRGWTPKVIEGGVARKSKKETLTNQDPVEQVPASSGAMLVQDMKYFVSNLDRLLQVPQRVDEITNFIFNLRNFTKNDRNINLRREGISLFSLENLADHILNSAEMDWKTKPSFYGAVILEYDSRMERVKELLPKE